MAPISSAVAWVSANKTIPYPTQLAVGEAATQEKILPQKGYTNALNRYDKSENIKMQPDIRNQKYRND